MTTSLPTPQDDGYAALLSELKARIRSARLLAAMAVNQELVLLYWSIGRDILARQSAEGLGRLGHRQAGGRPSPRLPGHDRPVSSQS